MKYLLMALDVAIAILCVVTIVLWFADRKNNRIAEDLNQLVVEE